MNEKMRKNVVVKNINQVKDNPKSKHKFSKKKRLKLKINKIFLF